MPGLLAGARARRTRTRRSSVLGIPVNGVFLYGERVLRADIRERPVDSIATMYERLSEIERVFRSLKGELDIRPIYYRKDDRVIAHVLICQLAFLLMVLMDRQAKEGRLT